MSAAFRCDRCKKFEEGKPAASVTVDVEHPLKPEGDRFTALCRDCTLSFRRWRREPDPESV